MLFGHHNISGVLCIQHAEKPRVSICIEDISNSLSILVRQWSALNSMLACFVTCVREAATQIRENPRLAQTRLFFRWKFNLLWAMHCWTGHGFQGKNLSKHTFLWVTQLSFCKQLLSSGQWSGNIVFIHWTRIAKQFQKPHLVQFSQPVSSPRENYEGVFLSLRFFPFLSRCTWADTCAKKYKEAFHVPAHRDNMSIEIWRKLRDVYSALTLSQTQVWVWFHHFKEGTRLWSWPWTSARCARKWDGQWQWLWFQLADIADFAHLVEFLFKF